MILKAKALFGAGGFAREVEQHMKRRALFGAGGFSIVVSTYIGKMPKFVDNKYWTPNNDRIYPASEFDPKKYRILATIADPIARADIVNRLPEETDFFSFVHYTSSLLDKKTIHIGKGSFVAAKCVITTDVVIGDHCHLNLLSTVGHGCRIGDCFTTAPGAKISGNCDLGNNVYVGTNAAIKQGITVCSNVIIGMNASVIRDILEPGVYVGSPARKVRSL